MCVWRGGGIWGRVPGVDKAESCRREQERSGGIEVGRGEGLCKGPKVGGS